MEEAVFALFIITAVLDLSVIFPTAYQAYTHYSHFCVKRRSYLFLCYIFIAIEKATSGVIQVLFVAPISAQALNNWQYWLGAFEGCGYIWNLTTIVLTWSLIICSMKFKHSMRKVATRTYWTFNIVNAILHGLCWFITTNYWTISEYVTIAAVVIMLISLAGVYSAIRASLRKSVKWHETDRKLLTQLDRLTLLLIIVAVISLAFEMPIFGYKNASALSYQIMELFEHLAGIVVDCTVLYILYYFARNSAEASDTRLAGSGTGSGSGSGATASNSGSSVTSSVTVNVSASV